MNKKYQKTMLNVIESIKKIIDIVEVKIIKDEAILAIEVLEECIDAISVLEKYILKFDNKELLIDVQILKTQFLSIKNNIDNSVMLLGAIDKSKIMITNIIDKLMNILENYCDVLFLPYKSSMWDSLESVWKAVVEDKGCRAYVVPIPYYEKNEDGSLGDMHYEGDSFPSYVPIIDYRTCDIGKLVPDYIFIHNPYDECNRVISIHPDYYTKELKKYTDCLVYIPYYVSDECIPTNTASMNAREGFCMTPGVINSDVVILQSENVKQLFVNILEQNMPHISRKYWEEKIWGLGSPKLDRVNVIQRNDNFLSDNWKRIIYKENGKRKKVVFYNTSLKDLLQHENMLEKIRDTLEFFKYNQDVALWWRPHPLYESTLESLRPHMLAEYRAIVKEYKEQQWGIFDDGVDLNWAIAETDAYYGDNSSVVQLFKTAQKPAMIQNTQIKHSEEYTDVPIWPSAFCVDGDDVWFVHGKINALMKYNLRTKSTYFVASIPNELMFKEILYSGIYKWKNRVYMIPCWAREIVVYNNSTREMEKISIKDIEQYDNRMLFCKVFVEGKYLYCIPYYYNHVIKLDMESMDIKYIAVNKNNDECINDATRCTDSIIAIAQNKLFYINLERDISEIKHISENIGMFNHITSLGQEIVCTDSVSNSIQCFDSKSLKVKKELYVEGKTEGKINSLFNNQIIIDAVEESTLKIISLKEDIQEIIYTQKEEVKSSLASSFGCSESGAIYKDNCVYYFNVSDCTMIRFMDNGMKDVFVFSNQVLNFEEYKKNIQIENIEECVENEIWRVGDWSKALNKCFIKQDKKEQNFGSAIWKRIRENI